SLQIRADRAGRSVMKPPTEIQRLVARRSRAMLIAPSAMLTVACFAPGALAQSRLVFGIDYRGGTIAQPATGTGTPITEADVLAPPNGVPSFGPLPPPELLFNGQQVGLTTYAICVGHPPGTPCRVEVDAISFGKDAKFDNTIPPGPGVAGRARLYFSVDR